MSRNMNQLFTIIIVILLSTGTILPQLTAVLTIENQEVVGSEFFFDLYLRTSNASDSIFLGNSDFVLSFDVGNFSSPVFSAVGESPGEWTFIPRLATGSNIFATRLFYFDQPAVEIRNGNQLYINLQGPAPTSTTINTRVARIDNQDLTHCLGRFQVSGISNFNGFMNLQWVTASTIVTSFDPSTLDSDEIAISAIDPTSQPLPVELSSFISKLINDKVQLNWQTKTEVSNYGFNVERSVKDGEWSTIGFVEGYGNSNSPKHYSFSDKDLFAGSSEFRYRLKQIDTDGKFEYSDVVAVTVIPAQFELAQNYPNPFNPSTTIRFSLPQSAQIKLNVYNLLGQQIATIAEGLFEQGFHKVEFNADNLSSGAYIYRIESSDFVQVKKMVLIK